MGILFSLVLSLASFASPVRELASISPESRVVHSRELLGKSYKRKIVLPKEEGVLEQKIFATIEKQLPKKYKKQAHEITNAVITEANKHGLDPLFVMAVISGESSFNPEAVGPVGEIGLMQIRPSTGEWIANYASIPWKGEKDLKNPLKNIQLGVTYIGLLRKKFEGHSQLYLAAYNLGPKSVKRALARNVKPKDYPIHVMKRYLAYYKALNEKRSI
jgi:soluble lytic murein transglycosylase